jgi:ABC-type enterobactin transport system permease subunit
MKVTINIMTRKKYRLRNFLLDALLTVVTGGFWLIWIFVREMRRK